MMTKVKVCGITNDDDMMKAAVHGAWAVGFIFVKASPRYVSPSRVRKMLEKLPPFVTPVGVFANQSERAVKDILKFTRISTVQFHGEEPPKYCKRFTECKIIKAFRVRDIFDFSQVSRYKVDAYLFDTYQENVLGGSGQTFNWDLLKGQKFERPVILSGGLQGENVLQAIETLQPYAVDVCSGIEKEPGQKDPRKLRTFLDLVKGQNVLK